jgi:hypothetical protein
MTGRFSGLKQHCILIQKLIPKYVVSSTYTDIRPSLEFYSDDLQEPSIILGEWERWHNRWPKTAVQDLPSNALEALNHCTFKYPNKMKLLKIFATLPVLTSTAERSFSILRRLKTYLLTTTAADRLNGLALMSIHRDISINIDAEDVINGLSKKKR